VVQLLADDTGYPARLVSNGDDTRKLIDSSDWVLVTRDANFVSELDTSVMLDAITVPAHLQLWTDDHNNLFQILRPVSFHEK
jgi:hypothetical protein